MSRKKKGYKSSNANASKGNKHVSTAPGSVQASNATIDHASASTQPLASPSVQPDQLSLEAYQHIQLCLQGKRWLQKESVTAILRLSQHLRLFGLLSAIGYLNQPKNGEVQKWVKPMWTPLLWNLVFGHQPMEPDQVQARRQLMVEVQQMAVANAPVYMTLWRKSLILSNHWNFWARAYQEEKENGSTENSNAAD